MNRGTKMALGVGIPVAVIIIILVVGLSMAYQGNLQNREYCNEWSMQIEQQRSDLTGEFIQTDQECEVFNQQVEQYNQECAG